MYELSQDLTVHIPTWTVVLTLFPMYDLIHCLYWATCQYNNIHGYGDMEQKNNQTWKPSFGSMSILVIPSHDVTSNS